MLTKSLDPFSHQVFKILRTRFGPLEGKTFLLAYSGGADSTALLGLLCQIQPFAGYKLKALWVDHGLRPADERLKEKNVVVSNCRHLGVELTLKTLTPPSETFPGGVEAWARKHRRELLHEAALNFQASGILTAHHRDDQVETVLMRLFRGHSYLGLGGIPRASGLYFRPLLDFTRAEIRQWLVRTQLPWWDDSTNAQGIHERNRLRRELTPVLDRLYPHWRRALAEWSEDQRGRIATLQEQLAPTLGSESPEVSRAVWDSWDGETRIWFLARAFSSPRQERIPRRWFLQALKDLEHRGQTELYQGLRAFWGDNVLKVSREVAKNPDIGYFKTIEWDSSISLLGLTYTISRRGGDWEIPFSSAGLRLLSRNWAEGLEFPGGGKGLKDLFQTWKIPPADRGGVTVLADREKILGIFARTDRGQVWVRPPEPGQTVMYLTVR